MTEFVQRFLLNNTKFLQRLVNDKLAKKKGAVGKFFSWMEIGPRSNGDHYIPKWFRFWNTYMLNFGFRFNWARPILMKFFTKEREALMTGYAAFFIAWAWLIRKNKIRPLYQYEDYFLHDYDNPAKMSKKWGMYIPFNYANFKVSAHYLEIDKLYFQQMLPKYENVYKQIEKEFNKATEKVKRTKYLVNPNYVYEPFGFELSNTQ